MRPNMRMKLTHWWNISTASLFPFSKSPSSPLTQQTWKKEIPGMSSPGFARRLLVGPRIWYGSIARKQGRHSISQSWNRGVAGRRHYPLCFQLPRTCFCIGQDPCGSWEDSYKLPNIQPSALSLQPEIGQTPGKPQNHVDPLSQHTLSQHSQPDPASSHWTRIDPEIAVHAQLHVALDITMS